MVPRLDKGVWKLVILCSFVLGHWSFASRAELFDGNIVHRLRIELGPVETAELRKDSRKYVPVVVRDGKEIWARVGLHLKGSTGSFRGLDDKPGLTLNFGEFVPEQRFYGLQKIHLNNSVEDPSYLNERLGSELFRAAGVPAPRVAHAVVELNGRRLGLYVLKEGFTGDFLRLYFPSTPGNFYDRDLDQNAGAPDLNALASAVQEPDLPERWRRLEKILDLDQFISFMAMEVLVGHRDGYCLARNNFRIYHHVATDKFFFFPHGMDQLFGKADAPMQPKMNGVVARAVMETPEGRQRYHERFVLLVTNVLDAPGLSRRADQVLAELRSAVNPAEGRSLEQAVNAVKERIARRRAELLKQLRQPELKPLTFERGIATLAGWEAVDPPPNGVMERTSAPDGRAALRIRAGPVTAASWRAKVILGKGRYRFEGAVCTKGIEPLGFGRNSGASLRLFGMPGVERGSSLIGDQAWKPVRVEFEVMAVDQELSLACELRGRAGEAWFDLDSLRLVLVDDAAAPKAW